MTDEKRWLSEVKVAKMKGPKRNVMIAFRAYAYIYSCVYFLFMKLFKLF